MERNQVRMMSNSPLVVYTKLSPNHSGPRKHVIDTITIHCVAGNASIESLGNWFAQSSVQASSNYGVDSKGRIGLFVDEANRSWCSSSSANDNRAITIEVSNTAGAPDWPVSSEAMAAVIDLCTDICKRNNIKQLLWLADNTLIDRVDLQNMTAHRWFAPKACPGSYLYNRFGDIAKKVTMRLKGEAKMTEELKEQIRAICQEEIAAALQKRNPMYMDYADVPIYWQPMIKELLDRDILNGGTPREINATDVNLTQDTIKACILMKLYIDQKLSMPHFGPACLDDDEEKTLSGLLTDD